MVNKIEFKCNFPKLCNQANAKLVWIDEIRDCDFILKYPHLKALFEYDTKQPDGKFYNINRGDYLLLFFVGDKVIMFSTLRRDNPSNRSKYINKIGKWFEVEIKADNDKRSVSEK